MAESGPFSTSTAFCAKCGSILPLLQEFGSVKCYACKAVYDAESEGKHREETCRSKNYEACVTDPVWRCAHHPYTGEINLKFQYTIHFNTVSTVTNDNILNMDDPEGPVVERRCPRCGNDRMSYATLQLRSADEGQTVFYTCVSCKYKETENS